MLSPAALSILMNTFKAGKPRAHALAAWGAVGGAGAAIGVLIGGTLTELVGWQAIFLINVPVGLAVAIAARKLIPADAVLSALERTRPPRRRSGDRRASAQSYSRSPRPRRRLDLAADARASAAPVSPGCCASCWSNCARSTRCFASSAWATAASAAASR